MTAVGANGVITTELYGEHYFNNQRGKDGEYMCKLTEAMELGNMCINRFYKSTIENKRPVRH